MEGPSEFLQMALIQGATPQNATYALALSKGREERALELLSMLDDANEYLGAIGLNAPPDQALLRFLAQPRTAAAERPTSRLHGLPHDVKARLFLLSGTGSTCSKARLIDELCHDAPSESRCYEDAIGVATAYHGDSQVVLSRRLLRFLCRDARQQMHAMQTSTFRIFDQHVALRGFRDRVKRGTMRSATFFLSHLDGTELARLTVTFAEFEQAHPPSAASRADAFGKYVKRRVRDDLLRPNEPRLEHDVMRGVDVQLTFSLDPHVG